MGPQTGTNNSSQSGPESNGNEGVLHISKSFRTGTSPSDVVWCQDTCWLQRSYPSVEMQLVYSTASADWATEHSLGGGSYPSVEMQSVYATAPDDWAFFYSVCIDYKLEFIWFK